jgi:hypothetical protein
VGESESRPHHQLKGCQWVSRRVNRCIASGKGVETGGNLYLDMEVAKGSEVAGTTVTSGWVVLYVSWLTCGSMHSGDDLGIAVVVLAPIWVGLQSAVTGTFKMIVAVVGGFVITVGEAVVCAVAHFSQRHRFFSAFFNAALVAVSVDCTGAVCASG